MSSPRARANHALYLAGILISQWRETLAAQDLPQSAVNAAFLPAVRLHLGQAYGWFLLQLAGEDSWAADPPARTADLPAVPEGKAEPGEIAEFRLLEQEGWLQEMLDTSDAAPPVRRSRAPGLAVADAGEPDLERAGAWRERLISIVDRMSDSLDEY